MERQVGGYCQVRFHLSSSLSFGFDFRGSNMSNHRGDTSHTYGRFQFFDHMWRTDTDRCRIIWQGLNFRRDHRQFWLLVNVWAGCHGHLSVRCVYLLAVVVLVLLSCGGYGYTWIWMRRAWNTLFAMGMIWRFVGRRWIYLTQWMRCGAIRISDITGWSHTIAIQILICHRVLAVIQRIRCKIALHRHIFEANRNQQNNNNNKEKKHSDSWTIEHFAAGSPPPYQKCKSYGIYLGLSVTVMLLTLAVDILPPTAGCELSRGQISVSISAMHWSRCRSKRVLQPWSPSDGTDGSGGGSGVDRYRATSFAQST